jgi:nicotinate-nucleotide pyrophosphorylase (carboxylating)
LVSGSHPEASAIWSPLAVYLPELIDPLIRRALEEDLAGGDLTSDALIPGDDWARAIAVAKSELVVSGGYLFARVFYLVSPSCRVVELVPDGVRVIPGTPLFEIDGRTRELLAAERTALNLLQRMCGTATLTRRFVEAARGRCRIVDTRKTTPGLRALERKAVRDGGGHNHRDNLGSAVLIKDNHIAAVGSIPLAIERARAYAPHTTRIEVEVTNLEQLEEALSAGADIIMLDNFGLELMREAVRINQKRAILEVSGGVTLNRVDELAELGVDVLSVGALTHSAPAADISLELSPIAEGAPLAPQG